MGEYTRVVTWHTTGHVPGPISLGLKNRHLQLIGIGGAIGAGFFLGSGAAISQAGPALLIAYVLTGAVIFLMMRALGEMTLAYPAAGSFSSYATQFIGPLVGFITGWSYWLACLLVGVAEMTGVGFLLHHWFPHLPQWIPALCAALLLYGINMRGVRSFGEMEYWLTMIKVATIVAVLLCGFAILLFKIGGLGKQAAISNLWARGGFLPNGMHGLLTALPLVIFSYGGIESIGLASAETERAAYTLPRAINGTLYRILLFYVGSFAVIMMLYPWNLLDPKQSPFVMVLAYAGFPAAANAVTFVAITALLSSCNTGLFGTSRMLHALASSGQAPARLRKLNDQNIPFLSLAVSGSILMFGVVLNYLIPDKILGYLLTMVAWLLLWVWSSIALSHLFYRRAAARDNSRHVIFRMPGSPYTNWAILLVMGVVAVMIAANGSSLITLYLLLSWIASLTLSYYYNRSRRLSEEPSRMQLPFTQTTCQANNPTLNSPDQNTKGAIEHA
jgi:amino acid transporter, AAT family